MCTHLLVVIDYAHEERDLLLFGVSLAVAMAEEMEVLMLKSYFCLFSTISLYLGMHNSLPPPNSTSSTDILLVGLVEPVDLYHLIL